MHHYQLPTGKGLPPRDDGEILIYVILSAAKGLTAGMEILCCARNDRLPRSWFDRLTTSGLGFTLQSSSERGWWEKREGRCGGAP